MKRKKYPTAFIAVGVGAGLAIGVPNQQIALGVGLGLVFGLTLMLIAQRRQRTKPGE